MLLISSFQRSSDQLSPTESTGLSASVAYLVIAFRRRQQRRRKRIKRCGRETMGMGREKKHEPASCAPLGNLVDSTWLIKVRAIIEDKETMIFFCCSNIFRAGRHIFWHYSHCPTPTPSSLLLFTLNPAVTGQNITRNNRFLKSVENFYPVGIFVHPMFVVASPVQ